MKPGFIGYRPLLIDELLQAVDQCKYRFLRAIPWDPAPPLFFLQEFLDIKTAFLVFLQLPPE